jgi:hypothetical protein
VRRLTSVVPAAALEREQWRPRLSMADTSLLTKEPIKHWTQAEAAVFMVLSGIEMTTHGFGHACDRSNRPLAR